MRKPFRFKQFSIMDTNCAMKLSTDAVLLGAWAEIGKSKRILDIGTGSGIIAVMLAQRSVAEIDAIDIHTPSCEDAAINFENCPWKERLHPYNLSLSDFLKVEPQKYDLIVSNPPFHSKSLKSPSDKANLSRHTTNLTHGELINGINKILLPSGKFCIILPTPEYQNFRLLAANQGFFSRQECSVIPKWGKPVNRIMMEFVLQLPNEIIRSEITIRSVAENYHESYVELTKDFYLNF